MEDEYPEGESAPAPDTEDKETDEGETALVPRSLFGSDCKVGDEYTVKVVGVLEDELEVAPVKKDSKPESETPEKSRLAMAGEQLDMMES